MITPYAYDSKIMQIYDKMCDMKVAIICSSVLLKQALSIFLKDYVSSYKSCDFVICDKKINIEKPSFIIGNFEGSNLPIPFGKTNLIITLERYFKQLKQSQKPKDKKAINFEELEDKIALACKKFEQEIIQIIKDSHE